MKPITLLIADDHRLFRMGLRQLVEKHPDIRVVGEAATGFEAVEAVREHKPDIALMDISMPEMNGIEATRKIAADHTATRVIILSMHADRRYIVEALRAGAKGYLLKDAAPEELMQAIKRVLDDQFYLSAKINEHVISDFIQWAKPDSDSAFGTLSAREREVLQLLAEGKSTQQIAERLNISAKTVETHRAHIMDKLNIRTLPELTRYAIREGLTSLD